MANLWTAASDGDVERVKHLLTSESGSGLNASSADANGYTALHAAASWGHAGLLRMLVADYGGDINIADNDGDTPLFTVESLDMCKLVLELGGDPTLVDGEGLTAARFLLEDHEEIARYLAQLTGEELPAAASTSEVPMDADGSPAPASTTATNGATDTADVQEALRSAAVPPADLDTMDPASRQAAIETNNRAGTLLSRVQDILLEADRTGQDPEAQIRAVVDEAVRGSMQAGREIAEMQVEEQLKTEQPKQVEDGSSKRTRTDDEPER